MDYIFGKNTVESFLDSKSIVEVYIVNNFSDDRILPRLKQEKIKITIKDKNYLDKITNNGKHQGIVALIKSYNYSSLEEIIEIGKTKQYPFIVMLDGIEDPHNFGAIIRTCEAFKVDGIIIGKHSNCPLNATVAKVSTGKIANIKIAQVNNLTNTIKELKKCGYWIYAAEASNSQSYDKVDYKSPVCLVVGSEGFGISRLVKEQADFNISIKMYGKVNSLNVSVATAILVSYISLNQNM